MKTIEQIDNRIRDLENTGNATSEEKEKNKCRRELRIARIVRMYLEYEPNQEFIVRQLDIALANIARVSKDFYHAFPAGCTAKRRSEFMKGKGLPELKKQVEILKYML
jgi:hypothetical protein